MELSDQVKIWLKGAGAAFLGGALGVISEAAEERPFTSWRVMLLKVGIGGGTALYAYLKHSPRQSPLPTNKEKES